MMFLKISCTHVFLLFDTLYYVGTTVYMSAMQRPGAGNKAPFIEKIVGSQNRLCMVKVFDETNMVPHGTSVRYGWAFPIQTVVKPAGVASRDALSPRFVENHLNDFYHFTMSY